MTVAGIAKAMAARWPILFVFEMTTNRKDLVSKWSDTMLAQERAHLLAAWQHHRSCADCHYWGDLDDDLYPVTKQACCVAPDNRAPCASFITPADYTCGSWQARNDSAIVTEE